jgi:hypothetical protein
MVIKMTRNKKYPIDLRKGRVNYPNLERRIGEFLSHEAFHAGWVFGIELYESDIQWIENNISKNSQNNNRDILWRFDNQHGRCSPHLLDYIATFFESFIDTPGIPRNANRILICAVGRCRAWYSISTAKIEPYQHFFIER